MRYQFVIADQLSDRVLDAFPQMQSCAGPVGGTVLFGPVRDAAELQSIVIRLSGFGIHVVEMRQLPD